MAVVKANGIGKVYPEGTTYLEIARDFQDQYENDILLVRVNGKLRELDKTLTEDSEISFITAEGNAGYKTYERSAIFLMLKAFYEVVPREKIRKIQIDFALGNGIYGELVGDVPVDEKLLLKVKAQMEKLRDAAIPVKKRSINTDDAVELFGKHGMHDKEQLFQYRRASRVNIYSIGEFEDYFYGYMVPDTSYVKYFDLVPCHAGFLLLLPVKSDPKHVEHPAVREKLFSILHSSYRWSDSLEVPNVGALNKMIADGKGQDLILLASPGDNSNYITLTESGTVSVTSKQCTLLQTTGEGGGTATLFPFGRDSSVGICINSISREGSTFRSIRSMGCNPSILWTSIRQLFVLGSGSSTVDAGSQIRLYGLR